VGGWSLAGGFGWTSMVFSANYAVRTDPVTLNNPRGSSLKMNEISVGQVWVCDATEDVPPFICIVGNTENIAGPDGVEHRVVSVTIKPHPKCDPVEWKTIWHMPVTEAGFHTSGLRLTEHQSLPSETFWSGHAIWSAKFRAGEARVFADQIGQAYLWGIQAAREAQKGR
jgi:hypothetical protein